MEESQWRDCSGYHLLIAAQSQVGHTQKPRNLCSYTHPPLLLLHSSLALPLLLVFVSFYSTRQLSVTITTTLLLLRSYLFPIHPPFRLSTPTSFNNNNNKKKDSVLKFLYKLFLFLFLKTKIKNKSKHILHNQLSISYLIYYNILFIVFHRHLNVKCESHG